MDLGQGPGARSGVSKGLAPGGWLVEIADDASLDEKLVRTLEAMRAAAG